MSPDSPLFYVTQQPQPQLLLLQPQLLLQPLLPQPQQKMMRMRIIIQQQLPSKHPFISHISNLIWYLEQRVFRAVHSALYDAAGNV